MAVVTLFPYSLLLLSTLLPSALVVGGIDQKLAKSSRSEGINRPLHLQSLDNNPLAELELSFGSDSSNPVAIPISPKLTSAVSNGQTAEEKTPSSNNAGSIGGTRRNLPRAETATDKDLNIITQRRIDNIMSSLIPLPGRLILDPANISSW